MAQTELRLRLIKDGKIVGYAQIKDGRFKYSAMGKAWWLPIRNDDEDYYIKHDSFELGIKTNDKWYFNGDRLEDCRKIKPKVIPHGKGTVVYKDGICVMNWDDGHYGDYLLNYPLNDFKRIGTIHDKEKNDVFKTD